MRQIFDLLGTHLIDKMIENAHKVSLEVLDLGLKQCHEIFREQAKQTFSKVNETLLLSSGYTNSNSTEIVAK